MDIFLPVRFRTQVQLTPSGISGNIDHHIHEKIKKSLEGICSRYGFIRPGSIEILKRSMGAFVKQHFNGHIKYDMLCKADICNPVRGMVCKAIVKNKNDLGILAESTIMVDDKKLPILDILIPKRSAGITSDIDLDTINIGDEIFVEVLGKRYQLYDKKISIIARAVKEPAKKRLKNIMSKEKLASDDEEILGKSSFGDDEEQEDLENVDGGSEDESEDEGEEETDDEENEKKSDGGDDSEDDDDDDEADEDAGGSDLEEEGGSDLDEAVVGGELGPDDF